jgi:carbamoyltransferase
LSTWILGISALYHDSAAVLLCDGELVFAAQEERFTRIKHDRALPLRASRWCLEQAGITAGQLDHLVFYEKPLRKFERILATTVATFPRSWRLFPRMMHGWMGDKLWLRGRLAARFQVPPDRILFCEHHLSHAASAFFTAPAEEAAILTVDGVGEWATTSLWRGSAEPPYIEPVSEIRYPHSVGLFYSTITAYLGFTVNNGEYKVMGLAPLGAPKYREEMARLLRLREDGSFDLDLDYFSFHYHPTQSGTEKLSTLLGGPPRFPDAPLDLSTSEGRRYADIAASAQAAIEEAMLHLAAHAHRVVGTDTLCLAGGVALNSVANRRLAESGPFSRLWVQPAAGDAGGAMGAALWAWHMVLGEPRRPIRLPLALGASFSRSAVREILDDLGFPYTDLGSVEAAADAAAAELAEGGVLGWFAGRFEWGPRALGHRSILADPRSAEMKDTVNARIKFRESFRPFAPSVLEEEAAAWFDIPPAASELARYMLTTAGVHADQRSRIPATTHEDGSARVQVVCAEDSPIFHRLISGFAERTGVPVVLNTSLNLRGDPIVSTPMGAVATLLRCELDALYIEGFRLPRPSRPARRVVGTMGND